MTETIQAERVTLYDLIDKFNFKLSENPAFFREWQDNLPEINQREKQQLHRVKNNYFNLAMRPMVEDMVKMVVVSPLLDLAGFFTSFLYYCGEFYRD
ncbi:MULTISPECIES: hypothetical protein [Okeania]|uniref:hypothetical protein n=1 Tax=Okeania TaxID=1458928 RepID=UPI00142BE1F2|nr:hypothetical protein [Okeania sp. SIO2B9]NES87901.1 hypothetical protein [Okeania sp. SIO2B9]